MRDDLEQEVGLTECRTNAVDIGRAMLVAYRRCRDSNRAVVERADQRIDLRPQRRARKLFGKTPEFAPGRDGRMVVEKHAVVVAALPTAE
jgi:hypothetical protein